MQKTPIFALSLLGLCSFGLASKGQFQTSPGFTDYEVVVKFKASPLPPSLTESMALAQLEAKFGVQYQSVWGNQGTGGSSSLGADLRLVQSQAQNSQDFLALCAGFENFASVEYCDLIPKGIQPPYLNSDPMLPAPTQNWVSQQGYLNAAPQGIDAQWAWSMGITGSGVIAHDAEWAWNQDHEEWAPGKVQVGLAEPAEDYADHGTAVLGEIMAAPNGYGVTGGAYGLDQIWTYSEVTGTGRTGAIAAAIQRAQAGEVLVLEMQAGGCHANGDASMYGPADYNQSVWDLVKQATDKGIIVIAAAGNGQQDLDNSCFANYRARGDDGSIIVGAGTATARTPASFTTYGSRVDVQGWGDWSVYTTGYGGLYNGGPNSTYTSSFSGTSSATPIVAAAAILIQSWAKAHLGRPLTPTEMRSILKSTGTAQGAHVRTIGPLPNVKAAIEKLALDNGINNWASSSSTNSSSSTLSSSSLSSSSVQSSSSNLSSSSQGTIDCSSYATWNNSSYNWSATKEYVTWVSKLWSHTDWVGGEPGVDAGWKLEGFCQTSSSSSQSSSSSLNSSSSGTVALHSGSTPLLQTWTSTQVQIHASGAFQVQIRDLAGHVHFASQGQGTQWLRHGLPTGIWLVQITSQGKTQVFRQRIL